MVRNTFIHGKEGKNRHGYRYGRICGFEAIGVFCLNSWEALGMRTMRIILLIILLSPLHFLCREKEVYIELPEVDDPCEIKICRLVEEIVHEEQIPVKVKERR